MTVGVLQNASSNQTDSVTATTGSVFVAQSPEPFGYDANGNLLTDGRWTYTWDAENRLIGMETDTNKVGAASVPRQKLVFTYDAQSRRISKVVSNWTGSAWAETTNLRFVYDRWNLVAELNQTNAVVRTYTWGLDLSGTRQGAGGIGGLLAVTAGTNGTHFVAFDGNGNVAGLVNASTGAESARYEYGPFGEVIRATGPAAELNVFRFSTKYQDQETGLLYYGYRYYQPSTGRWVSRDPIGERGGVNLYEYVRSNPLSFVDPFGLSACNCGPDIESELSTTLGSVGTWYSQQSLWRKFLSCIAIYNPIGFATAWDIYGIDQRWQSSVGNCGNTATFRGKCYMQGAVNYAIWGKINRLCYESFGSTPFNPWLVSQAQQWINSTIATILPSLGEVLGSLQQGPPSPVVMLSPWTLQSAVALTHLYKGFFGVVGGGVVSSPTLTARIHSQALAFTVYGYNGQLPPSLTCSECSPNTTTSTGEITGWRWQPFHQ